MAFARLTLSRKFARDIEACLRAQAGKLLPHGHQEPGVAQYSRPCQREPRLAHLRRLCPVAHRHRPSSLWRRIVWRRSERHGLCSGRQHHRPALSVFPWAPFRSTKAAVNLHTLLDLRGNIPSFIHISNDELHDVKVLDLLFCPEPGAFYIVDRGLLDFERLYQLHEAKSLFVSPRQIQPSKPNVVIRVPVDRSTGLICDQTIVLARLFLSSKVSTRRCVAFSNSRIPQPASASCSFTNNFILPAFTITKLY